MAITYMIELDNEKELAELEKIAKDRSWNIMPYGIIGKIVSAISLHRYMKRLLQRRNFIIKEFAETNM